MFGSLKDISEREGCALRYRSRDVESVESQPRRNVRNSDDLRNFVQVAYKGAEREYFRVFSKKKDELSLFCARSALV